MSKWLKVPVHYHADSVSAAKYVAKVWRKYALWNTKIHIRRKFVVCATIKNLGDALRFYACGRQEEERNKQLKKQQ